MPDKHENFDLWEARCSNCSWRMDPYPARNSVEFWAEMHQLETGHKTVLKGEVGTSLVREVKGIDLRV